MLGALSVAGLPAWLQLLCFLAAGGAGGLLRHLLSRGGLILPSKKRVGDETLLRLGFVASMLIGAGAGAAVDQNLATAFGYGIAGPYTLEKLGQLVLNGGKK